jgi:hypothetical protein
MIEEAIKEKLARLIVRSRKASKNDLDDGLSWDGWLTEALHITELVFPNETSTYRAQVRQIMSNEMWGATYKVTAMGSILRGLQEDIQLGLITKLSSKIRAETFDDFLDHAESYRENGRKNEAGVIAGVVFEDTIRRVYREQLAENDTGKKLEDIINDLAKRQILTAQQSKQAKVAAHVRTKATHAQWDEFDLSGVESTIHITRRLLGEHMGA